MDTVPIPHNPTDKYKRYNASSRGKERRTKYRRDNSKWTTDAAYLSRPIRAWDGEGITDSTGAHHYVMFACQIDGDTQSIVNVDGLASAEIFSFILDNTDDHAINVIFGGGYDFNMWLRDFSRDELEELYSSKFMVWNGYRLSWQRGKAFSIRRVDRDGKPTGHNARIYDVVSFFQCAFVAACDSYLGDRFVDRDLIVENKALRSSFSLDDVETVLTYNKAELTNLTMLVAELRRRLNAVGLRPARWDGPGAIAAALLTREGVKKARAESPPDVATAARYAYAGGRFEVIKHGHSDAPAYEYDVNSAYPAALRHVPDLTDGTWIHHDGEHDAEFALYHIRWSLNDMLRPGPFFRRNKNGTICYPVEGESWYWTPEYRSGRAYCDEYGYGTMTVSETWEFRPNPGARKPFDFVEGLYNKRRALKKAGDGANVGIKLGLNSLYGKLAQQVGWELRKGVLRIPPYHQIEWAGYTTSYCRARVLTACLSKIGSVIAFETDAVFTTEPLDVPLSSDLGDFEEVRFEDLSYIQSGLYFGESDTNISKTRGVDRGNLLRNDVLSRMGEAEASERMATVTLTRFVGAGIALSQSFDRWRRWETVTKNIALQPGGKRIHNDLSCRACDGTPGLTLGTFHSTICPYMDGGHSHEFPVEWINPNPEMDMLSELREGVTEWE